MWAALEDICRYFYDNGDFYVKVLEYQGQNSFREYFAAVLQPLLSGYLSETVHGDERQAFFVEFFADALLVSIEKWLKRRDRMSPERYVSLLQATVRRIYAAQEHAE